MKNLASILVALLMYVPVVTAQKVTLRFEGLSNTDNTTAQTYMADVDGKKYYSTDGELTSNSAARQIVISNLPTGSHKITVYGTDNDATNTANEPIYSNSFQLRSGYDMVIAIRRNGQVSFSEKKVKQNSSAASKTPMADAEFEKQLKAVNAKWSQTSKYNAIKSALSNKANYFTTDQVGQFLLLITSEPKRLELAKLSYPRITDPENFADVSDLFKTQANKDNIDKFIQSKNPEMGTTAGVNPARPPISTQQFNQLQRKIKNQYQESGKVAVLKDALTVTTDYYATAQLKQLLLLIPTETERLALAKQAYTRVSDEANFASLNTIFNSQVNRDEFNSYVKYGGNVSANTISNRSAMSDSDFSELQMKARLHIRQSSTVRDIKNAFSAANNFFSVDQVRSLLNMVSAESDRLTLAKLVYGKTVDQNNFTQLYDLFTSQASINDLNNYIKSISLR